MLATRAWAALFAVGPFAGITYVLFRQSGEKHDKSARERFWRPIMVVAELASSFGVVVAIAAAAQFFIKSETEEYQHSFVQASARRQGSAFIVSMAACTNLSVSEASFKQLAALSQLCALSRALSQPNGPLLDASIAELDRYQPLPSSVARVLMPQIKELSKSLRDEIEAGRKLHVRGLQARTRPGEADWVVVVAAAGVLFGATLKFSRALSEWWHRRSEA